MFFQAMPLPALLILIRYSTASVLIVGGVVGESMLFQCYRVGAFHGAKFTRHHQGILVRMSYLTVVS